MVDANWLITVEESCSLSSLQRSASLLYWVSSPDVVVMEAEVLAIAMLVAVAVGTV